MLGLMVFPHYTTNSWSLLAGLRRFSHRAASCPAARGSAGEGDGGAERAFGLGRRGCVLGGGRQRHGTSGLIKREGSRREPGKEKLWPCNHLPSHQRTWFGAQIFVEKRLSSWRGPFCTSTLVGEGKITHPHTKQCGRIKAPMLPYRISSSLGSHSWGWNPPFISLKASRVQSLVL